MMNEPNYQIESEKPQKASKFHLFPVWRHLSFFFVGAIGLTLFATIVLMIMQVVYQKEGHPITSDADLTILDQIIINSISYSLAALTILLLTLKEPLMTILRQFKVKVALIDGIAYGFLLLVVSSALSLVINWIRGGGGVNENEQGIREMAKLYPFVTIIMTVILAPICEEMTYRLGLFNLCRRYNRYLAYIVTALIFALIHFTIPDANAENAQALWANELWNLPSYLVSGIILCRAYEKHANIATSMIAHAINNGVAMLVIILF